jgi:hypothetical protein
MIELFLVQAVTNLALAAVVIKLRRELFPMIAAAGQPYASFWIRSVDVLVLRTPQLEAAKVVTRVRLLFTEEIHMTYRFRVYDVAMAPISRKFYKRWREWMGGNARYYCLVEKPRGLARLHNRAIEVVCYDKENEESRRRLEILLALKPKPKRRRAALQLFKKLK